MSIVNLTQGRILSRKSKLIICVAIFLIALALRCLYWQDSLTASTAGAVNQYTESVNTAGMPEHYRDNALLLLNGDVRTFLRGPAPPNDARVIMHPPGYSILAAFAFKVFGNSDASMRLVHLVLTSAAVVIVFLIAANLLPAGVAIIAALLTAFSPQLAFYSLGLRPDMLVPLPILLAIYFISRAIKGSRAHNMMAAGVFLGLSCWLRSDAMLLAPFLAVVVLPLLFGRSERWRLSLTLACAAILIIAPITIRNLIVFHHFIPVSLGSGVTLIIGIGEYDKEGKFGLPSSDFETVRMESKLYNRPDYSENLFNPDGILRERLRVERGLAVIRSHPLWFAGVMARRVIFMLRNERVPLISTSPAITHDHSTANDKQPAWSISPEEAILKGVGQSSEMLTSLAEGGRVLRMMGGNFSRVQRATFPASTIRRDTDYLLSVPLKLERGSATIHIESRNTGARLASTVTLVPRADISPESQPFVFVRIPFVSGQTDLITVVLDMGGTDGMGVVQLGAMKLFALGPASPFWTYYPRVLIRTVQGFFLTAYMLPLTVIGIGLLAMARQKAALIVLLAVPAYYLASHSLFHTEYRMVLPLQYFYSMLSALALHALFVLGRSLLKRVRAKRFDANS